MIRQLRSAEPTSLRRRVVLAFAGFALVLSISFAALVLYGMHLAEDRVVANYMAIEAEAYMEQLKSDAAAPLPAARWLRATLGATDLPAAWRSLADGLGDGFYELNPTGVEKEDICLLITTLPTGQRLHLWTREAEVEVLDASLAALTGILGVAVLLVTLLGIVLGQMTASRVIAPVVRLADRVRAHDTEEPEAPLDRDFAADEVGLLARTLDASFARSRAFLERERRFTRDASHELRSPVTVVRGAVELLEANDRASEPAIARPVARIRRAADTMSNLIEAFLWLAREEALSEGGRSQDLRAAVRTVVEQHRHLLSGKAVELEIRVDGQARVTAPDGILGIVLGNLVANAFFYIRRGRVEIVADGERFEVVDTGPGIPAERLEAMMEPHEKGQGSRGFGLGLAICRDLCERFGWRLRIDSEVEDGERDPSGTRAVVLFDP